MGSAVAKPLTRRRGKIKPNELVDNSVNGSKGENAGNLVEPHEPQVVDQKEAVDSSASYSHDTINVKPSKVKIDNTSFFNSSRFCNSCLAINKKPSIYDSDDEPGPVKLAKEECMGVLETVERLNDGEIFEEPNRVECKACDIESVNVGRLPLPPELQGKITTVYTQKTVADPVPCDGNQISQSEDIVEELVPTDDAYSNVFKNPFESPNEKNLAYQNTNCDSHTPGSDSETCNDIQEVASYPRSPVHFPSSVPEDDTEIEEIEETIVISEVDELETETCGLAVTGSMELGDAITVKPALPLDKMPPQHVGEGDVLSNKGDVDAVSSKCETPIKNSSRAEVNVSTLQPNSGSKTHLDSCFLDTTSNKVTSLTNVSSISLTGVSKLNPLHADKNGGSPDVLHDVAGAPGSHQTSSTSCHADKLKSSSSSKVSDETPSLTHPRIEDILNSDEDFMHELDEPYAKWHTRTSPEHMSANSPVESKQCHPAEIPPSPKLSDCAVEENNRVSPLKSVSVSSEEQESKPFKRSRPNSARLPRTQPNPTRSHTSSVKSDAEKKSVTECQPILSEKSSPREKVSPSPSNGDRCQHHSLDFSNSNENQHVQLSKSPMTSLGPPLEKISEFKWTAIGESDQAPSPHKQGKGNRPLSEPLQRPNGSTPTGQRPVSAKQSKPPLSRPVSSRASVSVHNSRENSNPSSPRLTVSKQSSSASLSKQSSTCVMPKFSKYATCVPTQTPPTSRPTSAQSNRCPSTTALSSHSLDIRLVQKTGQINEKVPERATGSPIPKASRTSLNNPAPNTSKTSLNSPVPKASNTLVNSPVAKASNTLVNSPVAKASNTLVNRPVAKASNTLVNSPAAKASNTLVNSPVPQASKTGLNSSVANASKTSLSSPVQMASKTSLNSPVPKVSNPSLNSPISKASKTGLDRPIANSSKTGVCSPIPNASKSSLNSSVSKASNASVKSVRSVKIESRQENTGKGDSLDVKKNDAATSETQYGSPAPSCKSSSTKVASKCSSHTGWKNTVVTSTGLGDGDSRKSPSTGRCTLTPVENMMEPLPSSSNSFDTGASPRRNESAAEEVDIRFYGANSPSTSYSGTHSPRDFNQRASCSKTKMVASSAMEGANSPTSATEHDPSASEEAGSSTSHDPTFLINKSISFNRIDNIRKQLYDEGLKPSEREGGVAFFIPVTEEGLRPQTASSTVTERLTKSKKSSLTHEERMLLANINRQVQLSKKREFAIRDIRNVKIATSNGDGNDKEKRDESRDRKRE